MEQKNKKRFWIDSVLKNIEDEVVQELQELRAAKRTITLSNIREKFNFYFKEEIEESPFWDIYSEEEKNEIAEKGKTVIRRLSGYLTVQTPELILSSQPSNWLSSERKNSWYYWPLFKEYLSQRLSPAAVLKIDDESDRVLSLLSEPRNEGEWNIRGMVMGSVQSGKTVNYSSLVCKAADSGYQLIIILSGIHNDLRQQTQIRLDEAFVGFHTFKEDGASLRS